MKYNTELSTIDDFYKTIYAIPPRDNRDKVTPREVTKKLLTVLGQPQKNFRSVLITGSKGKGSSAIYLSALLQNAGESVGLFSSPHLFDFRERIIVNGEMIEQRDLLMLAKKVFVAANELVIKNDDEFPRFFEVTTTIAYLYFQLRGVSYAVIETGIGALTDATNQDTHCLSILTNIESEHLNLFGDLTGLATEKAGVMRSGIPLILGDLPEEIDQLIIDKATALNVPVTRFKSQYIQNNKGFFPMRVGTDIWIANSKTKAKNAWVAMAAFRQLGLELSDEEMVDTFSHIRLPAREEVVSQTPFVIIDSAHTVESARNLANYVEKSVTFPPRKLVLLVSFSAEKNMQPVLSAFPNADMITLTQATKTRSISVEVATEKISKLTIFSKKPKIESIANPITALDSIMSRLKKDDVLIITGSVYLAGLLSQQFR